MKPEQEIRPAMQRGGAAECLVRIFPATSLSLIPPLWLLLFARMSAARHRPALDNENLSITVCVFLKTTSFLAFLVLAAALVLRFGGGGGCAWLVSVRRRLYGAVVWVLSVQVCLRLWVHCVEERDWSGGGDRRVGSFRSLVLALGLHEMVALWRRKVVKPAVDEAGFAFSEEGVISCWVEEVVAAAAFGCLWWWRLRREVEEVVAMGTEVDVVDVVDVVGWLLYGTTAAVGGVRVVKGLSWVAKKLFRRSTAKSLPL